jgi:signal transduction histidine kinase/Tfp pilus assembly protein PilF
MNNIRTYTVLFLFFYLFFPSLKAQTHVIDSVKALIDSTTNMKKKAFNLNFLSSLLSAEKPLESVYYAQQAVNLSTKHKDIAGRVLGYRQISIAYMAINKYDSCKIYLKKAIDLCKISGNKKQESSCLNTLGNVYLDLSMKKEALDCYLDALKLSESIKDTHNIPMRFVNVGRAHLSDNDFLQAKKYFMLGIKASEGVHNPNALSFALFNMGKVYYQSNQIDSAKYYYEKALYVEQKSIHSQNKREILGELAEVHEKLANYKLADKYLKDCLTDSKLTQDYKMEIICLTKLSKLNRIQKEWQMAVYYADLAFHKADSIQLLECINMSYFALSESYAGARNFEKAFEYQQLYKSTSDSIFSSNKSAQMQEMQTKYEVDKKETENELLRNKEAESSKRIKIQFGIIIGTTIMLLLVGFLSMSLQRSRRREKEINQELQEKNRLLEDLNIIKDKLFSIIGHDLRAPIGSLRSILGLLTDNTMSEEQVRMLFSKLIKEVDYTSDLLDSLLHWAKSQLQGMKVNIESIDIQKITNSTVGLLQGIADKKEIMLSNDIESPILAMGDEEMIKTVIRNLIANALKFTPKKGEVHLSASATDKQVEISVSDNGVGMSAEILAKLFKGNVTTRGTQNEKGTGLGLLMVKDFVEKNKGSIRVESEVGKGSRFVVALPKEVV